MSPAQLHSLLQTALAHHKAGRLTEAEKGYTRARAAAPGSFDAWHLAGTLALQQNRPAEAAVLLEKALGLKPTSAPAWLRLGIAHHQRGDFAAAEKCLRTSLELAPQVPETWNHLALTLRARGLRTDARAAYERALELKPDYAEVHDRLGALVAGIEGHAAAETHFRRAVTIAADYAQGWANLGASLVMLGRLSEAEPVLARALALAPGHAQALTARALMRERAYRIEEAVAGYAAVLAAAPDNLEARSARLLALHYLDGVSAEQLAEEHRAYGRAVQASGGRAGPLGPPSLAEKPDGGPSGPALPVKARAKLRVGFLSPDLRQHSVAYFLRPLLRGLDRTRFEIYLYHDHAGCDVVSRELAALADQWRQVAGLPDPALREVIRADRPDILVDLAGHTGGNRLALFARRLAPVQISYLGYPDTTGLTEMDFRLVDEVTDPVGAADAACTEHLVRFAPTAWVYSPPVEAPEPVPPLSVIDGTITFGCFNNFAKISEATLRAWAAVLAAVPGARLLLKGHGLGEPAVVAQQRERLTRCGLDPAAVEFLERTPTTTAHLATYGRVDVALDTFPYHGTTTTCEALWMGVPVVTLAGDRHASRVGVSLLRAIGRAEWVAEDWTGYIAQAVALANDEAGRVAWRRDARTVLRGSVLLDEAGQAARFGEALKQCWQKRGPAPAPPGTGMPTEHTDDTEKR